MAEGRGDGSRVPDEVRAERAKIRRRFQQLPALAHASEDPTNAAVSRAIGTAIKAGAEMATKRPRPTDGEEAPSAKRARTQADTASGTTPKATKKKKKQKKTPQSKTASE